PKVSHVTVAEQSDGTVLATIHADRGPKTQDMTALRLQLEALAEADPDGTVHLDLERPRATQEVLLRTPEVPGFGWRGLAPADLGDTAVRPEGQGITNGLVTVIPDQGDGTFSVNGVAGMGRLVDDGDAGDTYNWSPPPFDGAIDRPDDVDVLVSEAGPVRGRIEIARTYRWPTHLDEGRRVGTTEVVVRTQVELHAGEDLVRVTVRFENRSRDHRVRMWFPLPEPAATSVAECAFGTVERGLTAEGGPNEVGLPTYPSRRFVTSGGLQVHHEGLLEYELVDIDGEGVDTRAGALAVTLLRSVGVISAGPMAMRALPAGPPTPTPDAQMLGDQELQLVLHAGDRDPNAVADEAFTPLLTARFPGGDGLGDPDESGQALDVRGAEVSALTTRADGRIEVRVVNTADAPAMLTIAGRTGDRTDLRGEPTGERFDGTLELRAREIATVALD
ncbi:MAG: hypothetical protein KDA97_06435, partial [Acidimicrobiales bacterium]|nr:hypothetical protein [Acidimicrobiales bacterium]